MRYDDFRRSDDIEDRRDDGGGGGGGGGFGLPMGGGGLGIGTIIVLGLVGYAFGIDPRILIGGAEILTGGGQAPSYQTDRQSSSNAKRGAPTDEMGSMISGILGEIDDRWSEIFQASGQSCAYRSKGRAVPQRHQWRALRPGGVGDGTVLLSARQDHLPRHRFLPRGRDAFSRLLRQVGL
ncbi:putative metalloprotease [Bradyrhizobium sp. GM5.1]